jgi:hypothetical protein
VDAVNEAPSITYFQWHKPQDTLLVETVLKKRKFSHVQQLYWHKTNHLTQTPVSSYTSSVEMGTIGFMPSSQKCSWEMNPDPRQRHNFIECKAITSYLKDAEHNKLNPCQKPPELAQWLVKNHCNPGSWVLVLGAGAGGEVEGALKAGCNVVAVENDKRQFDGLSTRLCSLIAEQQHQLEKQSNEKSSKQKDTSADNTTDKSTAAPSVASLPTENVYSSRDNCIDCGAVFTGDDPAIISQYCTECNTKNPLHKRCCYKQPDGTFRCLDHCPTSNQTHTSTEGR